MHLAAVVGKVVGCGGASGCQTDGGCWKTMTKRYRRSHGGRDIAPRTVTVRWRATTPSQAHFHVSEEENANVVQWLEKLGAKRNRGGRE